MGNRNWAALGLGRAARTIPSWSPRPAAYDTYWFWLTLRYGQWAKDGQTISGTVALVSGENLGVIAPALLSYPRAGWGYRALSGIQFNNRTEPDVIPFLSHSGSLLNHDSSMLNRTHLTVSGTLQRELDERHKRTLRPNFVKRSP